MSTALNMDRALTKADLALMIRSAMKDDSYKKTPVGTLVGRYIRWFRNEWGATKSSVRDYEAILARMSITLADKEPYQVSIDDLRDVIDLWSLQTARTRQKVTSVIRAFWEWAEDEGHIAISPAARIKRPKAVKKVPRPLPASARPQLLVASKSPRDRLALFVLLLLGARREELCGLRVRDFDAERGWVYLYGKGQKERALPVRGPVLAELRLFLLADLPHVGRPPQPDDFLLYPTDRRAIGKLGPDGTMAYRLIGRPKDRPSPQAVHRWWYKQAQAAGLVPPGVTSGLNMHRARHTFAMELRRVAGLDSASQALGHSDVSTTLSAYGHQDAVELEDAMSKYLDWLTDEGSIVPPNDEGE